MKGLGGKVFMFLIIGLAAVGLWTCGSTALKGNTPTPVKNQVVVPPPTTLSIIDRITALEQQGKLSDADYIKSKLDQLQKEIDAINARLK